MLTAAVAFGIVVCSINSYNIIHTQPRFQSARRQQRKILEKIGIAPQRLAHDVCCEIVDHHKRDVVTKAKFHN